MNAVVTVMAVTGIERWAAAIAGVGLLVAGVLVAARARARGGQPVTPFVVFAIGWSFELLLFALPFVSYTDTATRTWLIVYGSIVTFLAGCLLANRFVRERRQDTEETLSAGRIRLAWGVSLALGLLGFAMYVRAVDAVLGWRALFEQADVVRAIQTSSTEFDEVYGPWRLLTYFTQIAFLLWTIGLRVGAFRGTWRFAAPLGLLCLVPLIFTGERTLLGTMLVWAMFFHVVWRPVRDWRRLIAGAVVGALVLATAFAILGGRVGKTIENHPEVGALVESDLIRPRALEYVYVTANIPALDKLMQDPIAPKTYGAMTLLPGVKLVNATGLGGYPPEEVGAFYPIPFFTFNNYSWLGTFYMDFGLVGCLVLPLLFGGLFTVVARRVGTRPTLLGAWTLSLVLYVVAFSPLLNKLSTTLTWQYLLIGPFLAPFLRAQTGLSPRNWLPAQRHRKPILAVTAVTLLVLSPASTLATDNLPAPATGRDLEARLDEAASRIEVIASRRAKPTPDPLASRLHVADPALRFVGMADYTEIPSETATVGVFVGTYDDAWLWGRSVDGDVRGMHIVFRGPARGRYPVEEGSRNLLTDGDLEAPLERPWQLSPSPVAQVDADPALSWASNGSVAIVGGRRRGRESAFLTQVVRRLPKREPGSVYTMRMMSYAKNLSRPLPASMKFTYTDGSQEFFAAAVGTSGHSDEELPVAIRRRTGPYWEPATAIGTASKRLRKIQVFLFDTGQERLSGRAWVDGASLTSGAGLAHFPDPF